MKKGIIAIMAIFFAFSVYAKDIQELVVTTNPPMSCQNCENKIKGNLRFEKGVKKIETNLADQKVTIEYDADKTTPANIESAFEKIGYQVKVLNQENEQPNACTSSPAAKTCCGGCSKNEKP
ncbi:MAG: heavy-metal-associated domain-containing protein [Muribaculaceae bacterium]|nr:heavy-metal-associated domain-containing protein [Muribaculaceae bacterium]